MKTEFGEAEINHKGYYAIISHGEYNAKELHRIVWENHYNKKVPENYVIHHINMDKTDNRIQNLICVSDNVHKSFHARHMTKEHKQKLSESKQGKNNPSYKNYARIIKAGIQHGRQKYSIIRDGKKLKESYFPSKLIEFFKSKYPNEILVLRKE